MDSVVVRDRATGRELARYTYDTYAEAGGACGAVRETRAQNQERVTVTVERERDRAAR